MNLFELIKFPYRTFRKFYLNHKKKKMGVWNFFLWQGKKAEEKIQREYYKQTFCAVKSEKTTVVYMANGFTWHGGLADRLKGIISLFCWCYDNNRTFKINTWREDKFERSVANGTETVFVTLRFCVVRKQLKATLKPNAAGVQLPPHYYRNG